MALPLKDPGLFREQCYVGGAWTGAADGGRVSSPPATVLASAPALGLLASVAVAAAAAVAETAGDTSVSKLKLIDRRCSVVPNPPPPPPPPPPTAAAAPAYEEAAA